jgi:hypothetical protein
MDNPTIPLPVTRVAFHERDHCVNTALQRQRRPASPIAVHGIPSRIRGDHDTENVRVAEWMEMHWGLGRGLYIWGR